MNEILHCFIYCQTTAISVSLINASFLRQLLYVIVISMSVHISIFSTDQHLIQIQQRPQVWNKPRPTHLVALCIVNIVCISNGRYFVHRNCLLTQLLHKVLVYVRMIWIFLYLWYVYVAAAFTLYTWLFQGCCFHSNKPPAIDEQNSSACCLCSTDAVLLHIIDFNRFT